MSYINLIQVNTRKLSRFEMYDYNKNVNTLLDEQIEMLKKMISVFEGIDQNTIKFVK
jgi:hypothetical protein